MAAATFWSYDQPSKSRGYPPALASAIVTIAITTCIAANFLLAHVATLSRNKLAEVSTCSARYSVYPNMVLGLELCFWSNLLLRDISEFILLPHRRFLTPGIVQIVLTRKELWKTIAQKENAEQAAAARSDFIASASHEIRTPLHHLQGYSDLLSRTELTEEGRVLLYAIQHATKTLSLSELRQCHCHAPY